MVDTSTTRFTIPSSLPDLERDPYNLQPYPESFQDSDEVVRGESFLELVRFIDQGNRTLASCSMQLFLPDDEYDEPWLQRDRMQALYTLVRYVILLLRSRKSVVDGLSLTSTALHLASHQ